MTLKAIIFDFDGLILDTETPDLDTWREVFTEHGASLEHDFWCQFVGRHDGFLDVLDHLELQIGFALDRDGVLERKRSRCLQIIHEQSPRLGVERWLADAAERALPCAIASSSSRLWVEGHLERLGLLSHFTRTHCRDDVQRTKPDPDVYLAAIKNLEVEPSEALAIEDSPHGAAAAKAAGIRCLAVPNDVTRQLDFSHADLVIDSLELITIEAISNCLFDGRSSQRGVAIQEILRNP